MTLFQKVLLPTSSNFESGPMHDGGSYRRKKSTFRGSIFDLLLTEPAKPDLGTRAGTRISDLKTIPTALRPCKEASEITF